MAYVVREDIIASIDETYNIIQGNSHTYTINLYKDNIGNYLNARNISIISVALLNKLGQKVLMYNHPQTPGVSDALILPDSRLNTPGRIQFEITEFQSRYLEAGDITIEGKRNSKQRSWRFICSNNVGIRRLFSKSKDIYITIIKVRANYRIGSRGWNRWRWWRNYSFNTNRSTFI